MRRTSFVVGHTGEVGGRTLMKCTTMTQLTRTLWHHRSECEMTMTLISLTTFGRLGRPCAAPLFITLSALGVWPDTVVGTGGTCWKSRQTSRPSTLTWWRVVGFISEDEDERCDGVADGHRGSGGRGWQSAPWDWM